MSAQASRTVAVAQAAAVIDDVIAHTQETDRPEDDTLWVGLKE